MLEFQRTVGNQAVSRLLGTGPTTRIGSDQQSGQSAASVALPQASHAYLGAEQQADATADALAGEHDAVKAIAQRTGFDFTAIQIHHDADAHALAKRYNARAMTIGNHIYFGRDEWQPESREGQRLLAHELTHVQQQHQWGTSLVQCAGSSTYSQVGADPTARPGRIISEQSTPEGVVIDIEVGRGAQRLGLEDTLPSGTQVNLEGWHRAHSSGAGVGAESGFGIRYAPPEVNLAYQNSGIENFIREFNREKAADVRLFVRTVTQSHPNSLRLKSITYRISAARGEGRPSALFEVSIHIENKTNNPRISLEEPEILGEWTEFLAPRQLTVTSESAATPAVKAPPGEPVEPQAPVSKASAASTVEGIRPSGTPAAAVPQAAEEAEVATQAVVSGETATIAAGAGTRVLGIAGRIGAAVLEAAILAVIALGLDYLRRRAEQELFRRRMQEARAQIESALQALDRQAQDLQRGAEGRTVWIHITIWVESHQTVSGGVGMLAYDYGFDNAGFDHATVGVDYQAGRSEKLGRPVTIPFGYGSSTFTPTRELVTYSVPVPYRAADLDLAARSRRIGNIERDATRPGLPQPALDVLFDERDSLLPQQLPTR